MKTALITGANRGIGLEFAHQLKQEGYYVIGCCRQPQEAVDLKQCADEIIALDVTSDEAIEALAQKLNQRPIDLLINNAGIAGDTGVTVGNINRDNFLKVLNVNCLSVLKISEALLDNVKNSQDKNILVISSQMGSIADNQSGRSYAYRASKAALNRAMKSFAIDVENLGVHVMLVHPGWVKTDMGGENALVDVSESVSGILKQAALHFPTSHAEVLRSFDGELVPW